MGYVRTAREIGRRLSALDSEVPLPSRSEAQKGATAAVAFLGIAAAFFWGTRGPRAFESKRYSYWRERQPEERMARP
jgi:hypothetical protein